jgi:signal transduction histidine kinase
VALIGIGLLRLLRRRSILVHITVIPAIALLAMVAGIVATAEAMFLSQHDYRVLLTVIAVVTVVSLAVAFHTGRRLARESVWARQARQRERQLEASRREVVAWVSHDLRTPLAGLRAMAEALEDGIVADPHTVAEYHRRIRLEADRMARLVDDLFELSRINAGALRLTLEAVSLAVVVSDAVASAAPVARARRVRVLAEPARYPIVRASEPELGRVLQNLLVNAIRHSPPHADIVVAGGADERGGWVAVSDACGGIPEGDLPRVFDVAFRGEAARTRSAGGGLGLAIARGLVEAHRGEIAVANVGSGCRFTVRIPDVAPG